MVLLQCTPYNACTYATKPFGSNPNLTSNIADRRQSLSKLQFADVRLGAIQSPYRSSSKLKATLNLHIRFQR